MRTEIRLPLWIIGVVLFISSIVSNFTYDVLAGKRATPRSAPEPTATAAVCDQPTGSGPDLTAASQGASAPEQSVVPPATPQAAPHRSGVASWYDDGPGLYAAVNSFRFGDAPYRVRVRYGSAYVDVVVRDHCNCYTGTSRERLIDLSPDAFDDLAPLSRGLIRDVVVEGIR